MSAPNELLNQLRDVHLPSAISFWPPAIGWYFVAILMAALLVVCGIKSRRWYYRGMAKRQALRILTQLQVCYQKRQFSLTRIATELSTLLRQVALAYYPRTEVAGLEGEAWWQFLQRTSAKGSAENLAVKQWLLTKPYQALPEDPSDKLDEVFQFCRSWISQQGKFF